MEMPIYRPIPQRSFDFTPTSSDQSIASSPNPDNTSPDMLAARSSEKSLPPSRTRSILNLTSSTLLGIYSNAVDGGKEELNTPWGTGAQTPNQRPSIDKSHLDALSVKFNTSTQKPRPISKPVRKGFRRFYLPLLFQTTMLFGFGVAFGLLITQLHQRQQITPVPIPDIANTIWYYQAAWGLLGVMIGNVLPRIDVLWEDEEDAVSGSFVANGSEQKKPRSLSSMSNQDFDRNSLTDSGLGPLWYSSVRSVGAFVGIAFALRRIPWQSTLQVAMTLAIANPVLWYLIDRSKSGFTLSALVSTVGTSVLLLVNPDFVPVPAIHHPQPSEKFGVFVWLASILFCSSLCFGAIGRKLQI